jgi:CRP-like cAMP-binding protein
MGRSGIVTRRYKSGSIVYFEGDKSEYIYILKSGRVILSYLKPETGEEIKEEMRPGEFFGVKSALGKYPREETVQTIGDTIVLVLTLADFEQLVLGNVQVVKKMLRVFSNQLRRVHKAVREVLGETDTVNPQVELYKLGDYYYQNGKYDQALYAFKKYMSYYPDEKYASHSMRHIEEIESGRAGTSSFSTGEDFLQAEDQPEFSFDSNGTSIGVDSSERADFDDSALGAQSEIDNGMGDFLDDGGIGDFLDEDIESIYNEVKQSINEEYNEASQAFSSGDFNAAIDSFTKIIEMTPGTPTEQDYVEKSHIFLAKSYIHNKNAKEAMTILFSFVKKFPRSANLKESLLEIGKIYKAVGSKEKSLAYFKKVAEMAPKDKFSQEALDFLNKIRE